MWGTYRREFVVSEEEMGSKVLVALIAHHAPTAMSCNGSQWPFGVGIIFLNFSTPSI